MAALLSSADDEAVLEDACWALYFVSNGDEDRVQVRVCMQPCSGAATKCLHKPKRASMASVHPRCRRTYSHIAIPACVWVHHV